MAINTPKEYKNLVIYEVYVRNHSTNGKFADLENDLPRIKSLGVDVIWLMPIHPIGKTNKKGKLGCPYSIIDYRNVNPEYGTKNDFKRLINTAHSLNLKVMIDVVFNHTAHDSVLALSHPDWFVQDANGKPVSTVSEWSDVVDLKFPNPELEDYLIKTLQMWIKFGVDGFRCDVASLIPLEFWMRARKAVDKINPEIIWLAESVDARWVAERRENGFTTISDSELYNAFDITYDYDIWPIWHAAVLGKVKSERYIEMLRFQDCIYPNNYIKLRCVENHDRKRIMALSPTRSQAIAWTAFQAFNKGTFLIYTGQESAAQNTPSLFRVDKIEWGKYELQDFIKTLVLLKKDQAQAEGK
ncbi:MAG: alpha-amylase, partial [Candidatus Heimdallarchaeota archaeon]|nr:alpha-amylase [Candidatus Heimdallarchaeota archaeon]